MAYGNYGRRRTFRRPYRRYGQKKIRMVAKSSLLRKRNKKPVTGIPLVKRIKVRKEILVNLNPTAMFGGVTGATGSILCIPCQNPNAGGVNYFATNSAASVWNDNVGCAGISEWFAFYNSLIVRGCKVKAEIVNNAVDPLVADIFPTQGWYAGNPLGNTSFDGYDIDPNEIPLNKRTFMGGVNSTNKGFVKNYVNVRKMLGVKDLEDVMSGYPNIADPSEAPFVPQVPIIASATDTDGQTPQTAGTLWLNLVFRRPNPNSSNQPQYPDVTVRLLTTYYLEYRSRKLLSGAN